MVGHGRQGSLTLILWLPKCNTKANATTTIVVSTVTFSTAANAVQAMVVGRQSQRNLTLTPGSPQIVVVSSVSTVAVVNTISSTVSSVSRHHFGSATLNSQVNYYICIAFRNKSLSSINMRLKKHFSWTLYFW